MKKNQSIVSVAVTEDIVDKYMADILYDNYRSYSSYIASGRTTVYVFDGMKTVTRRVLYSALRNCRKDNIKSVSLDGRTLSDYHPHSSCYGTIVGLVEDGLLIGKGNWGSHTGVIDIEPAAPRYTEVRLNPISEVLFINPKYLPYVDWRLSDVGKDEPVFLPVLIPPILTALSDESMMDVGTGIHLKNQYPKFSAESILNYIIHYLKTGKWNKNLLEFKFMNLVKPFGDGKDYDDTSFRFIETFTANMEVAKDGVYITTPLPDFNMESKLDGIPYQDFSKETTRVFIPNKYFDKKMFTSTVHFSSYAYSGDESNAIIHPYSIRVAVGRILENYRDIILPRYYKTEIGKIQDAITELEILLRIAKKINKAKDFMKVYETLDDTEKKIADKYSVSQMLKVKPEQIDKLKSQMEALIEEGKHPDQVLLSIYEDAKLQLKNYKSKK